MMNFSVLFLLFFVAVCENASQNPNFVFILTDDQDIAMGGMEPMQNVLRLIGSEGITFVNSFTTSPICCPSRASILTGQYVHNHLTLNNSLSGGCYSKFWKVKEKYTFATALQENGYSTFYAGKYLNEYGIKDAGGPEVVPPGWTQWHGLVGNSVYYNYTISHNGVPKHYNDTYLTDLIRDLTLKYIENQTESQPFLMMIAPPAPHQPFTPAPRHRGVFANETVEMLPNFNIAVNDKHWLMSMAPSPLPESMIPELSRVYRTRWESLLAVDELVADVIGALETRNLLDDTYIIFTSDNGYHIGQFAQVYDKRQPYESDIRVPLLIRGPLLKKNVTNSQPVLNIDLAPTILALAGLEDENVDGQAIDLETEENAAPVERQMLIEYYGEGRDETVDASCPWKYDGDNLAECYPQYECKCQDSRNNTYGCVRHIANWTDFKYCLFAQKESFEEIYDLNTDPNELTNIADRTLPSIKYWYKYTLAKLLDCKGSRRCDRLVRDAFKIYKFPTFGGRKRKRLRGKLKNRESFIIFKN